MADGWSFINTAKKRNGSDSARTAAFYGVGSMIDNIDAALEEGFNNYNNNNDDYIGYNTGASQSAAEEASRHAALLAKEYSRSAWDTIHEAERNLSSLDKTKQYYRDQYDALSKNVDASYDNANAMARRTADNDYYKNLQDFQSTARSAMTSAGGQYGSLPQSLNNLYDQGWSQQNADTAKTLEYNLQDAKDKWTNDINELNKAWNDENEQLEETKRTIDSNLKSALAQNASSLFSQLSTINDYDTRSKYIWDDGSRNMDAADVSGWSYYLDNSIDGVKLRNYMSDMKDYEKPVLLDNIKKGDQIAKKLAGYSTDNATLDRLTKSYSQHM